MAKNTSNKNQKQAHARIRILMMAAILLCVNILASYFHSGLDLTQEKRFTLSDPTRTLLKNMKEVAVVDVYLQGKFPAQLQRLQEAIRERLTSFKDIAGAKIVFRFIDPLEGKSTEEKKQIIHDLSGKGVKALQLDVREDEDYSSKVFFPYAYMQYNGKEVPIMLLEDPPNKSAAEKISYAEAMLEYKFASAINALNKPDITRIAYITGNGEDLGIKAYDMLATLPHYYILDTVDLTHVFQISRAYDAIIIASPTTPFTGPEKLKIDQYIMRGGRVLWALNKVNASLDSLRNASQFIAMDMPLEIDDLLFKYGVRVNNDLLEDMQCVQLGRKPENDVAQSRDWPYFPRLNPTADHQIVRNMDYVLGGFTNTIDTIRTAGIKKTTLLQSSKYSLKSFTPTRVSLSIMNFPLKYEMFNKSYLPVAMLLEGKFHSAYNNILAPEYLKLLDSIKAPFKAVCDSGNKMIVVSIGDVFTSDYSVKGGLLPMGYNKWTGEYFANKRFLLNCLEYLTDNSGVLEARSKQMKLRLLDNGRAKDEQTKWQTVNVAIPIVAVLVFASFYMFIRKRRYETKPITTKTSS